MYFERSVSGGLEECRLPSTLASGFLKRLLVRGRKEKVTLTWFGLSFCDWSLQLFEIVEWPFYAS